MPPAAPPARRMERELNGAQFDQAGHLGLPVLAAEVDVHPVFPDPRLRHFLRSRT
jgi:hypothetical protein